MKRPLCIYHANCMDGFAAAWVVWRMSSYGDGEFMAMNYDDPIPDFTGRDVCIVDYSFNDVKAFVEQASKANSILLLDHHKGADKKYAGIKFPDNVELRWDFEKAGVGVTWDYFMPGIPLSRLLTFIQARDLWHVNLHGVKEIHAYLKSLKLLLPADPVFDPIEEKFHRFSTEVEGLEHSQEWENNAILAGSAILQAEGVLLDSILRRTRTLARFVEYGPKEYDSQDWEPQRSYEIPIAEVPYEFASEAGNILAQGFPFSVTYETQWALGKRKFSIRSDAKTGINVLPIAQKMGGSGHEHAAGWYEDIHAELPFEPLTGY